MSTRLSDLTTLRVGGPVRRLVDATSEAEIVETVRDADAAGEPVLVLGGGSNLLAGDGPFDGVVVRDARRDLVVDSQDACGGASFRASAGLPWEDLVLRAVEEGWSGVEALAGIPGSTGAAPVQNVGAYGQEVGDVLAHVRTWDRELGRIRTLARGELELGYRTSLLKTSTGGRWHPTPRFVVLEVAFQAILATRSGPVGYAELAERLGVAVGERAPSAEVRAAVLELRRGKGMVLDPDDHDTWSAGSFFTNPVVPEGTALPEGAPRFDAGPGLVKTSGAWLIAAAGFARGHGTGPARLSGKHTLAITNRGGARATDVVALAREIRDGVRAATGVVLEPEPVLLGVSL